MKSIIDLIFNLCDCLQIIVNELVGLILQPIFFVIRTTIQCFEVFGIDIYPQAEEEEQTEENNNKHNTIGFKIK